MTLPQPLLTPDQLVHDASLGVEPGDVGIILKPNGEFRVFSTGMEAVTPETMTEAQREQGKRLIALSAALKSPDLMEMLLEAAENPMSFQQDRVVEYGHKH